MSRKNYYIIGFSLAGIFLLLCTFVLYFRIRSGVKNIDYPVIEVLQPVMEPESEPIDLVHKDGEPDPKDETRQEPAKPLNILEYLENAGKAADNCECEVMRENLKAAESFTDSTLKQILVQHKRAMLEHRCGVLLFKRGEFAEAAEAFEEAYDAFSKEAILHESREDLARSTAARINANKVGVFIKKSRIEGLLKTAKDLEHKKDYISLFDVYKKIADLYKNDDENYKILYEGLCIKARAESDPERAETLWQECHKVLMGAINIFVEIEAGDFAANRIRILRCECIAEIMLLKNEFEEGMSDLNSAIKYLENTKSQQLAAEAQIYIEQFEQKLERAKNAKREAEYRASGLFEGKATAMCIEAHAEYEKCNYDQAANLYQKTVELYNKELVVQKNLDRAEAVLRLENIILETDKLASDAEIKFLLRMAKEAGSANDFESERVYRAKIVEVSRGLDDPLALRKAEIGVKLSETKKYFDKNNFIKALQAAKEAQRLSEDYNSDAGIVALSAYAQQLIDYILLSELKAQFSYKTKEAALLQNKVNRGTITTNMPMFAEYQKLMTQVRYLELEIKAKEFALKNKYDKLAQKDSNESDKAQVPQQIEKTEALDKESTQIPEKDGPVEMEKSIDEAGYETAEEEPLEAKDALVEVNKGSKDEELVKKNEEGTEDEELVKAEDPTGYETAEEEPLEVGHDSDKSDTDEGYETAEEE